MKIVLVDNHTQTPQAATKVPRVVQSAVPWDTTTRPFWVRPLLQGPFPAEKLDFYYELYSKYLPYVVVWRLLSLKSFGCPQSATSLWHSSNTSTPSIPLQLRPGVIDDLSHGACVHVRQSAIIQGDSHRSASADQPLGVPP
eukprot:766794-Hanusia_phi.AAC.3